VEVVTKFIFALDGNDGRFSGNGTFSTTVVSAEGAPGVMCTENGLLNVTEERKGKKSQSKETVPRRFWKVNTE